ncbi:MAG: nitroreductase family protein [Candidatus Marinimicrobia bacterium]|nr:nitroreductase family protein [Candidatus Neomarinimicrobiota bacterium]
MNPAEVLQLLETRRSVRQFKQDSLSREVIEKCVNATRLAPSARNLQPLEFVYVDDAELVRKIFPMTKWAGYIMPQGNPKPGQEPVSYLVVLENKEISDANFKYDVGAYVENFLLACWGFEIGSCWILSVNREVLQSILEIPAKYEINCVVALGYPAESPMAEDTNDDIKYYKDSDDRLHVPKRKMDHIYHLNKIHEKR